MVDRKERMDFFLYVVLKVHKEMTPEAKGSRKVFLLYRERNKGDWSNGMTGVSKTLSGSSILSSPVI